MNLPDTKANKTGVKEIHHGVEFEQLTTPAPYHGTALGCDSKALVIATSYACVFHTSKKTLGDELMRLVGELGGKKSEAQKTPKGWAQCVVFQSKNNALSFGAAIPDVS